MMLAALSIVGFLAMQVVGTAQGRPDPDQLAAAHMEAFNAKDASRFAALFAEDAVLMPPQTPLIRGRAAIEAAYQARFAQPLGRLNMQRLDFDTHDERATAVGTFTLTTDDSSGATLKPAGGGSAIAGKYILIYKRVGRHWLIAFLIMNYDAPPR